MIFRRTRRGGFVSEKIKIEMNAKSFRQLIIADEAMRHIDINGLPSDQYVISIEYHGQDAETFNCRDTRPIYHKNQLKKIQFIHSRSAKVIWEAEFK